MVGEIVGHYRILGQLGAGGMAVVYEAQDERLGRRVALKFLPEHAGADAAARDRFLREAQTASSLNHPGICTIHELGEHSGQPFIVMERLEGCSLRERVALGRPSVAQLLDWAAGFLEALDVAHRAGVIHRDIKPENLFLTRDGRTKILDFGLARPGPSAAPAMDQTLLTVAGTVYGTIPYMSPEQLRGEAVDARTDLYSLGLTLYELATGVLPTRAETPALSMAAILKDEPPPPSRLRPELAGRFEWILLKSLSKDPARRYQSAGEMLDDARRFRDELTGKLSLGITLGGTAAQATARLAAVLSNAPSERPLVGRDRELAVLEQRLAGLGAGIGGIILLEGEPGLGKTRLLEWTLAQAAASGWVALKGRCSQAEGTLPFLPFVEQVEQLTRILPERILLDCLGGVGAEIARLTPRIRRLLPEEQKPLKVPPEQERFLLFSSLMEFLERVSARHPLLMAVEDLHWADESTLRFLEYLATRLRDLPVLVAGTMRPSSYEPGVQPALEDLERARTAERIRLSPLDVGEVSGLLAELAGVPVPEGISQAVYAITEGNPFFIEEVYRMLNAENRLVEASGAWRLKLDLADLDVPEGVKSLLERRFHRLRPATIQVLQRAALLGRSFRSELLEAVEGPGAGADAVVEALEEAEQAGLVTVAAAGGSIVCTFSHALVRQALLDGVSPWRQQRYHHRIAEALERLSGTGDTDRITEIAYHLMRAGSLADTEKYRRYLSLAAEQSLQRTAFEEAIRLFEQALPLAQVPGDRANLLFRLGLARTGLRDWGTAQRDWQEALQLYEQLGNAEGVGQITAILAAQFIWSGRRQDSIEISRRGLRSVGEEVSPFRCRLLAWTGHGLSQGGDMETGWQLTGEALAMAEQLDSDELTGHLLAHRACQAFYAGRFLEQAETAARAVGLLGDNPWDLAEALAIAAYGMFGAGRLEEAGRLAQRLAQLAERIGHVGSLWWCQRVRGGSEFVRTGDLDGFYRFAQTDLAICRQGGLPWVSQALTWLGIVEFWRGNRSAAAKWFDEAVAAEPRDFTFGYDTGQRMLFFAYCGRRDEPLAECREMARSSEPAATLGQRARLLAAAESAFLLAEAGLCAEFYPRIRNILDSGNVLHFGGTGLVSTTAGLAAEAGGHREQADQHFQAAMALADSMPHPVCQAESRRWYGNVLMTRKGAEAVRGRELLEQAIRRYEALGMPEHLQRCRIG